MYDLDATIRERRSVRGFFPEREVPLEIIRETLTLAQFTPSNCNVQPWDVTIVSRAACQRLRTVLVEAFDRGEAPTATTPMDSFRDEHRKRQIACAVEMYGKMGIGRDDGAGRMRAHRRNFELFDAPHAAIVCMKKEFGIGVALDVGMWVQTFMLALWSRGVGSCAQASVRLYSEIIKRELAIDPGLEILCGISFGYEDPFVPANQTRQPREPIESNVRILTE